MAEASDVSPAIREERRVLTDQLLGLSEEAWDAPSLCEGWRVRDVVGHLITAARPVPKVVLHLLAAGLDLERAIDRAARHHGSKPPAELLRRFRATIPSRSKPPMLRPVHMLWEIVIHGQDIRRPLELPHVFQAWCLTAVLTKLSGSDYPFFARERIGGLRMVATDVVWSAGSGPEVRGPGEAPLMTMAGRRHALDNLSGPGKPMLVSRFDHGLCESRR